MLKGSINILFGVRFVVVCLVFDGLIGWQMYRVHDARARYAVVQGVVTASTVVRSGSRRTTYAPGVEYQYVVGADTLFGDRYSYLNWSSSGKTSAEQVVAKYPVGSTVEVFYDPLQPDRSVLSMSYLEIPLLIVVLLPVFHFGALLSVVGIMKINPDNNQTEIA